MSSIEIREARLTSGLRLEYAERGSGVPIVFLHGYADSWLSFEQVLECLPDGFHGIAPTHRGHGGSDRPASGYRIEDFAADAVAFFDSLGLGRAALVGHSMGSLVAQEVALGHPGRVRSLVLAGSSAHYDNEAVHELHRAVQELTDPVPRAFAHEFQAGTCHRPLEPRRLARFVDESVKVGAGVWKEAIAGIVAYSSIDRLTRLSVPTLVIAADRDEIAPACEQRHFTSVPDVRWSLYEQSGHAMHWEQPQRFTDDVIAFVRASLRKVAQPSVSQSDRRARIGLGR